MLAVSVGCVWLWTDGEMDGAWAVGVGEVRLRWDEAGEEEG